MLICLQCSDPAWLRAGPVRGASNTDYVPANRGNGEGIRVGDPPVCLHPPTPASSLPAVACLSLQPMGMAKGRGSQCTYNRQRAEGIYNRKVKLPLSTHTKPASSWAVRTLWAQTCLCPLSHWGRDEESTGGLTWVGSEH